MRIARTTLLAFAGLLVAATTAVGQENAGEDQTPPAAEGQEPERLEPPRTTELVFEREVFDYPQFPRRNPFVALVDSEAGPRFEQMRLRGIIHSDRRDESVALLALGSGGETADPGADARGRSRRIRAGETWGNVRILEIRRTDILVQVEEFGLMEERIMHLPTRGQGDL